MEMTAAPTEELRFAVVLNGGVALAVWMGGVTGEISRLTRGSGLYGNLLDGLRLDARADVISGTSAGGINGAALALSQANRAADISVLRELWNEQGRFDVLLQQPFRGAPTSLLRGDDYFLPQLHSAMRRLTEAWDPTDLDRHPVDLTIRTTLLHGARTVTVDSLGTQLPQLEHEGAFRFVRHPGQAGRPRDDFDPRRDPAVAARLALAARSSASFPVAFEPSFVPARDRRTAGGDVVAAGGTAAVSDDDRLHRPDLGAFASWRTAGPADAVPEDRSRFAVDGGLLANTPTKDALAAISRMSAGPLVQRVMLLVYPHAPSNRVDPADRAAEPPTLVGALTGVLGALSSQGSRTFVEEVEARNRAAAGRRGTRRDILSTVGSPAELHTLAEVLYAHYHRLRIWRAGRDLASRFQAPTEWSFDRIADGANAAQSAWAEGPQRPLPYVPLALPDESDPLPQRWAWGTTPALDLADAAHDLFRSLYSVCTTASAPVLEQARDVVQQQRQELLRLRDSLDTPWNEHPVLAGLQPSQPYWALRLAVYAAATVGSAVDPRVIEAVADFEAATARDPQRSPVTVDALTEAVRTFPPNGIVGTEGAEAVEHIVAQVGAVLGVLDGIDPGRRTAAGLDPWHDLFVGVPRPPSQPDQPDPDADARSCAVLARLLDLHVASWTIADEGDLESNHPIDLVQVSLQTRSDFVVHSTDPADKVASEALRRFGGFLKRSWRMNDWAWGRLDAATMLCQVLFTPERLRRRFLQVGADGPEGEEAARIYVTALVTQLYGDHPPARVAALVKPAVDELTPLFRLEPDGPLPVGCPSLAAIAAWALHLRIAIEELPSIARAVRADEQERGNRYSRGRLLLDEFGGLLARLETHRPVDGAQALSDVEVDLGTQALAAIDWARLGFEQLRDEGTSDQLIRTATTAASVAVTVADSGHSGLGAIKPVTRALRGAMLVPYWTILGLTSGASIANFLAVLTIATGGLLLALSLLGVLPAAVEGAATAFGLATLLVAFGVAALRTRTLLHGLVLLTPVLPLVAFAAQEVFRSDAPSTSLGTFATVLGLAFALMVLGSLPAHLRSPFSVFGRTGERLAGRTPVLRRWAGPGHRRVWYAVLGWVVPALLVAAAVWLAGRTARTVRDLWQDLVAWVPGADLTWVWGVTLGIAVVAILVGWLVGWLFREWVLELAGASYQLRNVNHAAVTAATWAVFYGIVYLVATAAVIHAWPAGGSARWGWQVALATAGGFAVVLLFVAPVVTAARAHREVRRTLYADARAGLLGAAVTGAAGIADEDLVSVLVRRNTGYRLLLKSTGRPPLEEGADGWRARRAQRRLASGLELTSTGRRLGSGWSSGGADGPAAP